MSALLPASGLCDRDPASRVSVGFLVGFSTGFLYCASRSAASPDASPSLSWPRLASAFI